MNGCCDVLFACACSRVCCCRTCAL
jgi:hypothetical protein